jgi:pyruvate,water dikinase
VSEPLIAQIVNPFSSQEETAAFEFSLPYIRMIAKILRFMVRFPKQLPGLLATYRTQIDQVNEFPYDTASDREIYQQIYRLPFEYADKLLNNDFLMIAVIGRSYRILGALLKRHYHADTEEVVAKLISGVTGNVTMETNKRLWDLAKYARSEPFVGKTLRENDSAHARAILTQSDVGRGFIQALDRFLEEFGHREVHMDILYPTWCDDSEPVFSFIRSYLDADESQSPYYQQERLVHERQTLTRMVLHDLRKDLLGRVFLAPFTKWFLAQTQVHTRERDTMHFEMTRLFPPLRRLALELGRRWSEAGHLENQEDVFFLTMGELSDMASTPCPVQEVVKARRIVFENLHRQPWPYRINNGVEMFSGSAGTVDLEATGLRGIAGSPGLATGISRVIRGPGEFDRLKKGDILIAPITNPVWTPLFAVASAVVTEVGGILSHGAIVAREYGIPAVMSVVGATTLLKDGQRVIVDGNKGLVYLEGEA